MHKFFFYNEFIICLYMFRVLHAHHQDVKIILYSIWYHHTCRWPSGAKVERGVLRPVHRLREEPSFNLCTGRSPTGVMIPDAVKYNFDLLMMST